ncbi:hypothetical protein EDB87DRAFT_624233 [Lactarius vividus]|nr:hypothetical protein EDB87DRAFT_624233 [Lactarius vividus]
MFYGSLVRPQWREKPRRGAPGRRKGIPETLQTDLLQDDSLSPKVSLRRTTPCQLSIYQLIELTHKYRYRLILDEDMSFGTVGRTRCALMERRNVSVYVSFVSLCCVLAQLNCTGHGNRHDHWMVGGFCMGSHIVMDHRPITSASAGPRLLRRVPALLAVSASEGINILWNTPSILSTPQESVRVIRAVPNLVEAMTVLSHAASLIIHVYLRSAATLSAKPPNSVTPALRDAPSSNITGKDRPLQEIVAKALAQGVWTTRARRLRGQEPVEARPSMWRCRQVV